jgi:hypothetical protein
VCYPDLSSPFPVSVDFPPVLIRFHTPAYPDPAPVPDCFRPDPVSGDKMQERKWERVYPARFHPFSSLDTPTL